MTEIIFIAILFVYTFIISRTIGKYTKVENEKINAKKLGLNVLLIVIYSVATLLIMSVLLHFYLEATPSTNSELCHNSGGWVYSCKVDSAVALMTLIPMGIIIIIHHFLCQSCIYNIFKQNIGIFKHIFMYVYMGITYLFNCVFIVFLSGVLIGQYYDWAAVEMLRLCVAFLPSFIFIISTLLYYLKNRKQLS